MSENSSGIGDLVEIQMRLNRDIGEFKYKVWDDREKEIVAIFAKWWDALDFAKSTPSGARKIYKSGDVIQVTIA